MKRYTRKEREIKKKGKEVKIKRERKRKRVPSPPSLPYTLALKPKIRVHYSKVHANSPGREAKERLKGIHAGDLSRIFLRDDREAVNAKGFL